MLVLPHKAGPVQLLVMALLLDSWTKAYLRSNRTPVMFYQFPNGSFTQVKQMSTTIYYMYNTTVLCSGVWLLTLMTGNALRVETPMTLPMSW